MFRLPGGDMDFSFSLPDFSLALAAILLQSPPFLLLGALFSAAIDQFCPEAWLTRLLRVRPLPGMGAAALAGFCFPICECGALPVVRRLILRGVPISVATTYLFASSILNPLCVLSTWLAFRGPLASWMVGWRLAGGLLVVTLLFLLIRFWPRDRLLRRGFEQEVAACCPPGEVALRSWPERLKGFVHVFSQDFLGIAFYVLIGAAFAAYFSTHVSREAWGVYADNRWLGPLTTIGLAQVLCLCSTTDAFIIASVPSLPQGAMLAFLVAGPFFDLKLMWVYRSLFQWPVVLAIGAVTTVATWSLVQLLWK